MKPDSSPRPPFRRKMVVRVSGRGRTSTWPREQEGTVLRVSRGSVFVHWHGTCVDDQMEPWELVATGALNGRVPSEFLVVSGKPQKGGV